MFKTLINFCLIIPVFLIIPTRGVAQVERNTEETSVKKLLKQRLIRLEDIPEILSSSNLELKSLKKLEQASSFNLSSKLSQRYPKYHINKQFRIKIFEKISTSIIFRFIKQNITKISKAKFEC